MCFANTYLTTILFGLLFLSNAAIKNNLMDRKKIIIKFEKDHHACSQYFDKLKVCLEEEFKYLSLTFYYIFQSG